MNKGQQSTIYDALLSSSFVAASITVAVAAAVAVLHM